MSAKHEGWQIGMTVCLVFSARQHWRDPTIEDAVVTNVGRHWITAAITGDRFQWECRFDHESMLIDGGDYAPIGRAYLSRAEYEESTALVKAWSDLVLRFPRQPPACMTIEKVQTISELAGLPQND